MSNAIFYRVADVIGFTFRSQLSLMAADPVSINLAIRASLQKNVPEEQIAYGFSKTPLDQPAPRVVLPNLPEERLWSSVGPVIELKHRIPKRQRDDCDDEEDDEPQGRSIDSILSYGELGYGFTRPKDPVFVTKMTGEPYDDFHPNENCGLQLGSVEPICESSDNGEYRSQVSYF